MTSETQNLIPIRIRVSGEEPRYLYQDHAPCRSLVSRLRRAAPRRKGPWPSVVSRLTLKIR